MKLRHNDSGKLWLGTLLIIIPLIAAGTTFYYLFGSNLMTEFANRGNSRLTTDGWQTAQASLAAARPQYGPKFAYYKLQEGQNLAWAANHFSVSLAKLQQLNPGNAVWGTTIIVPPVEQPLVPFQASQSTLSGIVVTQAQGITYVNNRFANQEAMVTIPQLMQLLQRYNVISQVGPKKFLINKPLYIQNNVRVDITSDTVDTLLLLSAPDYDITTLTFQNSEALIKGVTISTLNPATNKPDPNPNDGRSFLRAYESARMDIIDSTSSYLGMTLEQIKDPVIRARTPFVSQGGVYGVSWRIGTGSFGSNVATGWVENSTFEHNHIGAFTFGASGMMWRNNLFTANDVYGLDPHDDSNNATIEYNRFVANGKHGFIVSKRCDYNIIKNNISVDNALHGFMLHDNSDYNIVENNISIGNYDNFVIYDSSFNTVSNNRSYNPRGSQVRLNQASNQNYIADNTFYGGKKGIFLYGNDSGVDITGNTFFNVTNQLVTRGVGRVLYADNQSNGVGYEPSAKDRVVFGVNTINKKPKLDLRPLQTITTGKADKQSLSVLAAKALKQ
jgi:parallel beta-helix repeat protein